MSAAVTVIRVLVVDDHAVVREGIRKVLSSDEQRGFEVVGEAADGQQAVEVVRDVRPDVVILDLSMPRLSGLQAAKMIRRQAPDVKVLVLSIHDHDEYVAQSVKAGAHGYLRKDSSPAELRAAVRAVFDGGSVFKMEAAMVPPTPALDEKLAALTTRERDVLVEIARGRTNKEIAAHFSISIRTVESHRETLMRKLGIRGAAALTRFAVECGIV